MPFVLALDQGTTSSRAIAVRSRRRACARVAQQEFRQIFPQPGWVEHDADEIWATQSRRAARGAREGGRRARATSPRSASPTSARRRVVWDRASGRADRTTRSSGRTGAPRAICDELRAAGHAPTFARKTGLVLDAYFSGTKLRWLLDHVPGARERAPSAASSRSAPIDTWLVWNLTRRPRARAPTRRTRAARCSSTSTRGDWDDELLRAARRAARGAAASRAVVGRVRRRRPIGGVDDPDRGHRRRPAGGAVRPGVPRAGPGEEHLRHRLLPADEHRRQRRSRSRNKLLTTVAWQRGGATEYALEGSVFIGGAVVQWLRDGLGIIAAPARSRRSRRAVPDNGGVLPRARRSPGSARRTGTRTRAARSSASRAAPPARTSRARRSRRSRSRAATCWPRCRGTPASRSRGCASTAARRERPADAVPGRPARRAGRAAEGARDDGARRGVPRGARGRLLEGRGRRSRATGRSTGAFEPAMSRAGTVRRAWSAAGEKAVDAWQREAPAGADARRLR